MTKAKHAGGRPTLYRLEMCDRLVEAMAKGLTAEAAAARIGISARSLFYWQQQLVGVTDDEIAEPESRRHRMEQ